MNMDTFLKTVLPIVLTALLGAGSCNMRLGRVESENQAKTGKLMRNLVLEISRQASKECK